MIWARDAQEGPAEARHTTDLEVQVQDVVLVQVMHTLTDLLRE